jgi:hypothetical protein
MGEGKLGHEQCPNEGKGMKSATLYIVYNAVHKKQ